eukprot:PhF_6_TR20546/c0_g1_i4/m.29672
MQDGGLTSLDELKRMLDSGRQPRDMSVSAPAAVPAPSPCIPTQPLYETPKIKTSRNSTTYSSGLEELQAMLGSGQPLPPVTREDLTRINSVSQQTIPTISHTRDAPSETPKKTPDIKPPIPKPTLTKTHSSPGLDDLKNLLDRGLQPDDIIPTTKQQVVVKKAETPPLLCQQHSKPTTTSSTKAMTPPPTPPRPRPKPTVSSYSGLEELKKSLMTERSCGQIPQKPPELTPSLTSSSQQRDDIATFLEVDSHTDLIPIGGGGGGNLEELSSTLARTQPAPIRSHTHNTSNHHYGEDDPLASRIEELETEVAALRRQLLNPQDHSSDVPQDRREMVVDSDDWTQFPPLPECWVPETVYVLDTSFLMCHGVNTFAEAGRFVVPWIVVHELDIHLKREVAPSDKKINAIGFAYVFNESTRTRSSSG